jgi:hypothetical protein
MKQLHRLCALSGVALVCNLTALPLTAQDSPPPRPAAAPVQPPDGPRPARDAQAQRRNFDPAQFMQTIQQRMLEGYRDKLDIKSDDEWKLVEERIGKVLKARMDTLTGGGGFMGFGGMGGGGGMGFGGGGPGGGGGQMRGLQALLGQPSPEAEALQKAVEAKASAAETKDALVKYREFKKRKQDELVKAQTELRQVLTPHQEAVMVLTGLLD